MSSATRKTAEFGILAEFETAADIYHACEQVRDAGYTVWDSHTPFPVHNLERAMGLKPSKLPWIVLAMGLTGAGSGLLLQWWVSAVAYPVVIAGKPYFSWPAFVPIIFELMVLFSAFGAVIGMLGINRLPHLYHPLFRSRRFEHFSDDRFFISIERVDPKYDREQTAELLRSLGAKHVEIVEP
jgi:hypothetical protein